MSKTYPKCAQRVAIVWCAAVLVAAILWPATLLASQVTETDDFAAAAAAVTDYADKFGPERVLLVVDIDNTLLAMNHALGSDQWFEWQQYLLEHEPRSKLLVAKSFKGLLDAQGLLYNLGRMHPPQKDLPLLVRRLQKRGIHTLVLTSRGDDFRVATERELARNEYDFSRSALPVRDVPNGRYPPYNLKEPEVDGLKPREVTAFRLGEPRLVSYANGIMMTSGQNKGAMLLTILHRAAVDIDAIVYADDHIRNVNAVYAAVIGRGGEVAAFNYTREEPNVKKFQYGSKRDVTCRWRRLSCVLNEVFE